VNGVGKVALPLWLAAVLSSWAVSVELGSATTLGLAVQWSLKAPANVAGWVAPVVVLVGGSLLYVFALGHLPGGWPPSHAWIAGLAFWITSSLGTASASGLTGGAPATNSLNKEVAK
jgi:hypothetical protein